MTKPTFGSFRARDVMMSLDEYANMAGYDRADEVARMRARGANAVRIHDGTITFLTINEQGYASPPLG